MVSSEWIASQVTIFQVMDALGVGDGGPEETRQIACPVHADTRPSARVYGGEDNTLYCFTCGRGWDVVGLVMAVRRVSFDAAATWITEEFNLGRAHDLPGRVRQALIGRGASVAPLFTMAESALRQARVRVPLDRYVRATMALDVLHDQYQRHEIDRKTVQQGLTRVLKYVGGSR